MKYRVKVKGGVSIFHDKELAEKCAEKNKTKVEEIKTEIKQKTQKLRLQEQRRKHTSLKKPDVSLPLPVKV